jgi:plasmid stability protein
MKNLQIRNVPHQTHAVLRRRAAASGMSLQEYLLALVKEAAGRPTVEEVLDRAGGRAGGRLPLSRASSTVRAERDRR